MLTAMWRDTIKSPLARERTGPGMTFLNGLWVCILIRANVDKLNPPWRGEQLRR